MTELTSNISIRSVNLFDLLTEMRSKGTIRIPHFQRDYVWERTRVADLFDSIFRQFPIGSFFFWITPRQYRNLYKDIPSLEFPAPSDYDQIKMILDGQQRLTSIFVAANGLKLTEGKSEKDYSKICFNLDTETFLVVRRKEDRQKIISVWRFFDKAGEEEIYDDLTQERRIVFRRCQRIITSYPISVVEVTDMNLTDAIRIFERINQGGKRLNLFDLVVASTWSNDFDLKEKVKELNTHLEKIGFGKIDEEVVAQCVTLVVKGQATRAMQLQLTNTEIKNVWDDVRKSIELAVDFIRNNLGVKIYDFLPYPSMLSMFGYVYYKLETRALSTEQISYISEWFWKVAFSQRYNSSTLTNMGNDIVEILNPMINNVFPKIRFSVSINTDDLENIRIYTRSAIKNAFLCILAQNEPLHFKNNSKILLDRALCSDYNNHEKHHIFPKAFLKLEHSLQKHLLLNFAFLPNELNNEISDTPPSKYLVNFKTINANLEISLKSHLIPYEGESGIWNDDYDTFIHDRAIIFSREIEKRVGKISATQVQLADDPMAVVTELEKNIRNFIDVTLSDSLGETYWGTIPSDIQDHVNQKIEQRINRQPYVRGKEMSNYERLTFCDLMDYNNLLQKHWKYFGRFFSSQTELQHHFINIKDFRNALVHSREMNAIEKKQGEASVEWLLEIINHQITVKAIKEADSSDEIAQLDEEIDIYCESMDIKANAVFLSNRKVKILKNSSSSLTDSPSFEGNPYQKIKNKLIEQKKLIKNEGKYFFNEDIIFDSTSAAAAVVLGRPASGPQEWKISSGISLREYFSDDENE